MNPYLIPGMERRPNGPLCPFQHPDHEEFYVPVDHSQTRYVEFTEEIGDSSGLIEDGRLMVAYGREKCGKTALLNRCAKYVRDDLVRRGKKCAVISLSDESIGSRSVADREKYVFDAVLDDIRKRDLLAASAYNELRDRRDDLLRAYRYLSDCLPADAVVVVLLPPVELAQELVDYASYVRPKLLLLAESSYVQDIDGTWPAIKAASTRVEPFRLMVERLRVEDGWVFASARQNMESENRDYPIVTEETMRLVTDGLKPSIGQLQSLLHGVYREILERRASGDALAFPEMHEVSYEYITDFFLRASGQGLMR